MPCRWLFTSIVLCCTVGVDSTNSTWDGWIVGAFDQIGYIFHKAGAEPAPLLLRLILGPVMEENMHRALLPVIVQMPAVKNKREEAFVED